MAVSAELQQWLEGKARLKEVQGWDEATLFDIAERGHALVVQGRYREAAVILAGLVALDPDRIDYRQTLGSIQLLLGDYEKAVDTFSDALRLSGRDPLSRACRCEALTHLGRLEEAEADRASLAAAAPRHPLLRRVEIQLRAAREKNRQLPRGRTDNPDRPERES